MLGLSHRQQLLIVLLAIFLVFCVWAKVDYAVIGYKGHYLPEEVVPHYWFWMWIVGVPLIAFVLALAYYAGAPDTDRNLWYAVGVFLTVVLLGVGELEDFLYFVLNAHPLPSGEWTWMPTYTLFGTWTTFHHLVWLSCFIMIVVIMWVIILEYA